MMMMLLLLLLLLLLFLVGGILATDDEKRPLVELLYTRDELTKLAGYGEEKLSTVVVAGTLLCHSFSNSIHHSHPIPVPVPVPGASVAVMCRYNKKRSKVRGKTDEYGDFLIDLPSHLHAIPNMERRCIFRIVGVPNKSVCSHPPKHKYYKLLLSSSGNGIRTYSIAHGNGNGNGIHLKQQ